MHRGYPRPQKFGRRGRAPGDGRTPQSREAKRARRAFSS
jgi:hypothetical protein